MTIGGKSVVCGLLLALLWGAMSNTQDRSGKDTLISARHMAALIVAYDDYRKWAGENGIVLTAQRLEDRHAGVEVREAGHQLAIYFSPPAAMSRGGAVRYLVDAKSLDIKERLFER